MSFSKKFLCGKGTCIYQSMTAAASLRKLSKVSHCKDTGIHDVYIY